MVQLNILSGKMAGTHWVARHFPVRIGRTAANELRLEENGVWDRHLELKFDAAEGFLIAAQPNASVTVNGQPVQAVRLRNGDSIEVGSVRLQFWLSAVGQRGLRLREWLVWTLLVAIPLAEIAIIYSLTK